MAVHPIKILYLFPAIFLPLLTVCEIPSLAQPSNGDLIDELQEIKLRISHLEIVLEESTQNLIQKSIELKEREELIEEMSRKIQFLDSALYEMKRKTSSNGERLAALEDEVRLLWAASRKNNFDIHILESKVQDAEEKLEEVTSQIEKMSDIVSEQWIQIQHLEQALEMTKIRALKVRRQVALTKCTFLKLVNTLFVNHLQRALQILNLHLFSKVPTSSSMITGARHHFEGVFREAKKYHHELQSLIKEEMERNEYTAILANREFVFFVASALVTFPIVGAWVLLSSQFYK